ncbi:TCP-1/cpn60 chaperonin family domain-containing protein [Ditylenchus destructor]|nr:TCP-1/cpn60 chaperonin family domain-containing protein [Ditylenchus destructor]
MMQLPKSGYARFMKEGAMHFKGMDEAVKRNIEACIELASQVRSAYGPNGMNKMVINRLEKLFITNDAVTILNELEVQHPAARILIMAAQMQEKQIGDNTNTVVIFGAALLEHAIKLLDMGITPIDIAAGYEEALDKAAEILPQLIVNTASDLYDLNCIRDYLKSSIMSKQSDHYGVISELVAKACVQIVPRNNSSNFNVDNIRVVKILGSGVASSRVVNGMMFRRGAEGEIKKASNPRIAVFACPFDLTQTETKGTVLMNTADELLQFSTTEESEVEGQVKALADAGVTVVVAAGKFGDLYVHYLNKYNIMGVRLTSKFDLRRLCRTVGAQAQSRICAPTVDLLGQCDEVYLEEIGETDVVVFNKTGEVGHVCTIVVRGSSQPLMDDIERAIDDAVNTYKALTKDNRLLPGAGAVEIELGRRIEAISERQADIRQYAIKNFALALESFPKQLAENAGLKPTETLSNLYASHQQGKVNDGIDVSAGTIVDAHEQKIYDVYSAKFLALKLATHAAATILKIDQLIMAKPAGGPAPKGPKGQDDDDDAGMA